MSRIALKVEFQSTLPARGATHQGVLCRCKVRKISIHAPRTGSDLRWLRTARRSLYFNPRSPHGERLFVKPWFYAEGLFQSTLPARGATATSGAGTQTKEISIHAPRTGSDGGVSEHHRAPLNFNPRSPHGERLLCVYDKSQNINFNPRSPHGERRRLRLRRCRLRRISIHAPRTGSDRVDDYHRWMRYLHFNPRSPHGERHPALRRVSESLPISIHAPRTGSDMRWNSSCIMARISIHAPRTGSDRIKPLHRVGVEISIHAPRTGSDFGAGARKQDNDISIHAPRTGSDDAWSAKRDWRTRFQSTLPARGATGSRNSGHQCASHFNPRSPHGERRINPVPCGRHSKHFNPRSPHGERRR